MQKPGNFLIVCIVGAMIALASGFTVQAAAPALADPPLHRGLAQPVTVWRDCQRMARCDRCSPVYRCRACNYQRTCRNGPCEFEDVCVWGPYLPRAPKGVRIIQ